MSETEQETSTALVVVPHTGEIVHRDDPAMCAAVLQEIRLLEERLKEAKDWLTDALAFESERVGSKTLTLHGRKVTLSAGYEVVWDVAELAKLKEAGLPDERYDALVQKKVEWKVNAAEAKRIATSPKYREIIQRARSHRPKKIYASVG